MKNRACNFGNLLLITTLLFSLIMTRSLGIIADCLLYYIRKCTQNYLESDLCLSNAQSEIRKRVWRASKTCQKCVLNAATVVRFRKFTATETL